MASWTSYPVLVQMDGWCKPQPRNGIGICAVIFVQHFGNLGFLQGHFFWGGPMVYSLVALAFPRPIQGWNLMISDYISRAYPGLSRPLPIALTRVHPYPLTSRPKAAVQNDHEWPLAEHDPSGLQGCQPSRRPLGLIRCEFGGIWPEGTRGVELCWNYG